MEPGVAEDCFLECSSRNGGLCGFSGCEGIALSCLVYGGEGAGVYVVSFGPTSAGSSAWVQSPRENDKFF